MDSSVKALFIKQRILDKVLNRYNLKKKEVTHLKGFENFVYEFNYLGKIYILKISHNSHRTTDLIKAELDWIKYLSANGVSVSEPVKFKGKSLLETFEVGSSYFSSVVFKKAKGRFPKRTEWGPRLFADWGRVMGKMHTLAKKYTPPKEFKRPEWFEADFLNIEKYLPNSEEVICKRFEELITRVHTFPKDKDSYGLVHLDLHSDNFFINNGGITIFDFDSSEYNWFIHDIAMVLFFVILKEYHVTNRREFICHFLKHFWEGYAKENSLNPSWFEKMPYFLKFREMELYIAILIDQSFEHLDDWKKKFLINRKYLIENDIPLIEMEFASKNLNLEK